MTLTDSGDIIPIATAVEDNVQDLVVTESGEVVALEPAATEATVASVVDILADIDASQVIAADPVATAQDPIVVLDPTQLAF